MRERSYGGTNSASSDLQVVKEDTPSLPHPWADQILNRDRTTPEQDQQSGSAKDDDPAAKHLFPAQLKDAQ
jgi:hypothetical protein